MRPKLPTTHSVVSKDDAFDNMIPIASIIDYIVTKANISLITFVEHNDEGRGTCELSIDLIKRASTRISAVCFGANL